MESFLSVLLSKCLHELLHPLTRRWECGGVDFPGVAPPRDIKLSAFRWWKKWRTRDFVLSDQLHSPLCGLFGVFLPSLPSKMWGVLSNEKSIERRLTLSPRVCDTSLTRGAADSKAAKISPWLKTTGKHRCFFRAWPSCYFLMRRGDFGWCVSNLGLMPQMLRHPAFLSTSL